MKVYICYYSWCDGFSEPMKVFANEDQAKLWQRTSKDEDGVYDEMEVEE